MEVNKQTLTRKGTFNSGHRIMHPLTNKGENLHGHTYMFEIGVGFKPNINSKQQAADLELFDKVVLNYIDTYYNHAMIVNPDDRSIITFIEEQGCKYVEMWLNNSLYCNPTVEHVALQLFYELTAVMGHRFALNHIRLYETPMLFTDIRLEDIEYKTLVAYTTKAHKLNRIKEWNIKTQ